MTDNKDEVVINNVFMYNESTENSNYNKLRIAMEKMVALENARDVYGHEKEEDINISGDRAFLKEEYQQTVELHDICSDYKLPISCNVRVLEITTWEKDGKQHKFTKKVKPYSHIATEECKSGIILTRKNKN